MDCLGALVLGYVMDNCIGFGVLLCFGIIVLVFGRCFVFWEVEILGGLRNGVKV